MNLICNSVFTSLFGSAILQPDQQDMLTILNHLMILQIKDCENPRRLLRHGSCAFSRLFKFFSEGLSSAKLFLTASLHDPILQLLMEDDICLDIDPSKSAIR